MSTEREWLVIVAALVVNKVIDRLRSNNMDVVRFEGHSRPDEPGSFMMAELPMHSAFRIMTWPMQPKEEHEHRFYESFAWRA